MTMMRVDLLATRKKKRHLATAVLAQLVLSFLFPLSASALTQNAYRWRNDDGSEATASFLAAENTTATLARDVAKRLRMGLHNNGAESEYLRQTALALTPSEMQIMTQVIDPVGGFLYLGLLSGAPGRIVKIRLSDFTRVGQLDLPILSNEGGILGGVIDTVNGFAYFSQSTVPAKIWKVRLSDFTSVGSITLQTGEQTIYSGVIDAAAGFAYFGTGTSPGKVVKIDLSTFTRVGAVTLQTGENIIRSSAIDVAGGFAYFGTDTSPGKIAKIALSSFTQSATLTLGASEDFLRTAVIDPAGGFVYFGTYTSPMRVVKVQLSTFTSAATLSLTDPQAVSAVIDTTNGFAYFSSANSPARIKKIRLSDFTLVTTLTLNGGEFSMESAAIDVAAGAAYFGNSSNVGQVVKVTLSTFTRAGAIAMEPGEGSINNNGAAIDTAAGFAYYGTNIFGTAKVVKVRLSDMSRIDAITLPTADGSSGAAVIDPTGGFLYLGMTTSPGRILKIRLSDFTKVATLTLAAGEGNLISGAIDTAAGFAYFGTTDNPAKIIKIRLSDFTKVATLTLAAGEYGTKSAVLDTVNEFLYFGTEPSPAKVIKIRLSDFTQMPTLTLSTGNNNLLAAAIDVAAGFAYFGTAGSPKLVKVNLATFTETATLTLSGSDVYTGVVDAASGFAYFAVSSNPILLYRIRLSDFTLAGTVGFSTNEYNPAGALIDIAKSHVYVAANDNTPARIVKVSIAPHVTPRLEYGLKVTTCAAIGAWTQVPTSVGSEHWQMIDSTNAVHGTATTNVASGLTDGNTVFKSGSFLDTSSQGTEIGFSTNNFTELEFSLKPTTQATLDATYCFRLTNAGSTTGLTFGQFAEAKVVASLGGAPSCPAPTVTIAFPNGGENIGTGSLQRIFWSNSGCGIIGMRLTLSTDGGATYHVVIIDNIGNAAQGFHDWTVPGELRSAKARVKLEALGQGGTVLTADASDKDFAISGPSEELPPAAAPPYVPEEEAEAAKDIDTVLGLAPVDGPVSCAPGTAFKGSTDTTYYCGIDGKKHVFPNERTFKTWFADFSQIAMISDDAVALIPDGDPVRYKPGVRMVKIQADAKTYAVAEGGVLRWVSSEEVAASLYGEDWNTKIDDMEETLFAAYAIGDPIL